MIGGRMVIHGENPTNDILIYIYSKCQDDLLSNAWTTPARIALFSFQQQHKSDPDLGPSVLASFDILVRITADIFGGPRHDGKPIVSMVSP